MVEVSIFGSVWFSFGLFVILLIVFHIVFVWLRPLSERAWKKTDYIWFGLTALSIVFATGDVRRTQAQNLLEAYKGRWETADKPLVSDLKFSVNFQCNTKYNKADWMPQAQWDEITRQQTATCEWMRATQKIVEKEVQKPKPDLRPEMLPASDHITEAPERSGIDMIRQQVVWYADTMHNKANLEADADRSEPEFGLFGLWPTLLAFAFALRITRIGGELSSSSST